MTVGPHRFLNINGFLVGAPVLPVPVPPPLARWVLGYGIQREEIRMESWQPAEDPAEPVAADPVGRTRNRTRLAVL